jgi:hypothetical protein
MKTHALFAVAGLALLLAGPAALAQKKVYRCEAGGKVTYGDSPCKGGAEVAVDDARSDADRKAARDAVQREKHATDQAAAERRVADAKAPRQVAGHIAYSDAVKAAASAPSPKPPAQRKAAAAPPARQP